MRTRRAAVSAVFAVPVLAALAGCGRLGFDPVATENPGDAPRDAIGDAIGDGPPLACEPVPCVGASRAMACNGRCFTYCDDTGNYAEAAARCTAWGGTVTTLPEEADVDCAVSLASFGWIGYVQSPSATVETDGWTWEDGRISTYTRWAGGEPNDNNPLEDGEEQCAHLYGNGDWNDRPCDSTIPQITCTR